MVMSVCVSGAASWPEGLFACWGLSVCSVCKTCRLGSAVSKTTFLSIRFKILLL